MTRGKDPPIAEQEFRAGLNVIDFGDVRVSRGLTRREFSSCPHRSLTYDPRERRIWCRDCERNIDGYDAFVLLAERAHAVRDSLDRRERAVREAERFTVRSIAAKSLDEAWRSRTMVPACPHCGHGLFPEHFQTAGLMLGKEYARAKLARAARLTKPTEDRP